MSFGAASCDTAKFQRALESARLLGMTRKANTLRRTAASRSMCSLFFPFSLLVRDCVRDWSRGAKKKRAAAGKSRPRSRSFPDKKRIEREKPKCVSHSIGSIERARPRSGCISKGERLRGYVLRAQRTNSFIFTAP